MKVSSVSPRAVADDGGVAEAAGEFDGFEGFGDGADLVDLDQDGVGDLLLDSLLQALRVGDEEVVADELDFVADLLGEELPAVPVVFGEAVFDGDDGVLLDPGLPEGGHLGGGELALVGFFEDVLAGFLVVELAGGGVEGDGDVCSPACSRRVRMASRMSSRASSLDLREGAKPPSSPTAVL